MKKSIRSISTAAMLLVTTLVFTSCEGVFDDIFGEWDKPGSVTSISLTKTTLSLVVGEADVTLTYTIEPANATDKTVIWNSDNTAVATVNEIGKVHAVAEGTATITVQAGKKTAVCVVTVSAAPSIPGLLAGVFSVSSTKKVRFSQGNLQAVFASAGSDCTWQFATNQWECIGNDAANNKIDGNGTVSAAGTVDLFGWVGESSTALSTAPAMYGISSSITQVDYGVNSNTDNLKSDWGTLAISNGGNTANYGWRTLTHAEWEWLIGKVTSPTPGTDCRTSSTIGTVGNARWMRAVVHSTNGLIIFPDEFSWNASTMGTVPTTINTQSDAFTHTLTDAQWTALETAGCVFLPLAGERSIITVTTGRARYWSSTYSSWNYSRSLNFHGTEVNTGGEIARGNGCSVRLVQDVK